MSSKTTFLLISGSAVDGEESAKFAICAAMVFLASVFLRLSSKFEGLDRLGFASGDKDEEELFNEDEELITGGGGVGEGLFIGDGEGDE